jgi:hypothetical protein
MARSGSHLKLCNSGKISWRWDGFGPLSPLPSPARAHHQVHGPGGHGHRDNHAGSTGTGILGQLAVLLAVAACVLAWFPVPVGAATASERAALADLYNFTSGPAWSSRTAWLSGDPCTQAWHGVACSAGGSVVYVSRKHYLSRLLIRSKFILNSSLCRIIRCCGLW